MTRLAKAAANKTMRPLDFYALFAGERIPMPLWKYPRKPPWQRPRGQQVV